jgi:phage terminase large subunit
MDNLIVPEVYLPLWTGKFPDTQEPIEHYAFYGGRGGAKSHSIGEAIIGASCKKEERIVCGRQFQNSIKDSVKELLQIKIKKMNMSAFFTETERELVNVSTGSRFSFIGMDRNPDSAKSLEGCTIFWGEEAHMFTAKSVEIIIPTVRTLGSRMIWSWNPRYRTDPVDNLFRGANIPERSYIRKVSWRDNPYFMQTRMPSEYRRSLKNPKRHVHIWEGGYDENPDVAIFDNWRVGRIDVPPKIRPRFGEDFGYGSDPNVIIKLYVLEDEGIVYIAEEAVGYKVSNRDLPALMDTITEIRDWPITADSARPETIEYLQSKGFSIHSARKGAGSVKNGINWLQGFELVISPDCPVTADEIRDYKWHTDPNGKPLPLPAPNQNDHCIDAIRYAVEDLTISYSGEQAADVLYI